jgi:hypothetical protein
MTAKEMQERMERYEKAFERINEILDKKDFSADGMAHNLGVIEAVLITAGRRDG